MTLLNESSGGTQVDSDDFLGGLVAKHCLPAFLRQNKQPFMHSIEQSNVLNVGLGQICMKIRNIDDCHGEIETHKNVD